ncbi:diguanylate cyclase [Marinomonas sp. CT5]|uniref:EAL domain-containing protein n=1 Tax=Marinomonas sp. CT5 TaxID=2066133 RepID=UPI001BAE7E7C|nr:EAL domain-containing protein [Marinomonas sp. CT5]QUX95780.1 diguanylate cyclase [Marinomonas sp. CT5]
MVFKWLCFFFLLTTPLWANNAFISENKINTYSHFPIPTFKETHSISAQEALHSDKFQKEMYDESQGFSQNAYWHKLQFSKNLTPNSERILYLGLNYYVIEHLDFYLFHGDQLQNSWTRGALDNWNETSNYKGIWIPLPLSNQQETTLLVRKQGNSPLLTPFELFDKNIAEQEQLQNQLLWTFIISSLSILLAHNIIIFILLRQPGSLYYLNLNIVVIVALSIITGFSRWTFSEELSQWLVENIFSIFGIGAWLLFRFSLHFLKEIGVPSPDSLIRKYGDGIFIVFFACTQILSVKTSALLFASLEIFMFVICIYWGIAAYLKGFIAARFYLISWVILIVGSILNTLIFWRILPINVMTQAIFPIACLLQLFCFSFALSDKAKQIERARKMEAMTDSSTGLPNRAYFFEKIPKVLIEAEVKQEKLALIMIDISNYQSLSQAFGPAKADKSIYEAINAIHTKVATMPEMMSFPLPNKTSKKIIRTTTKTIVLFSKAPSQFKEQIQYIQIALNNPDLISKTHFRHQYKIGSALYPTQGHHLDKLYQNALIASQSVKYSSGNWAPFTNNLKSNHAQQIELITLLTNDLQHNKLYFEIQPQIELISRKIIGGEVLIRWKNESLGQVSPGEFIPLAEQTGLIYQLTNMMLKKVFLWASKHAQTLSQKSLSINISAQDLLQEHFASMVIEQLNSHQLHANQFTIEITETSVFQNSDTVHHNVKQLHQAGFKLAIDDFGVGYSSMQNLIALETDELKIDQFFVMKLINDLPSQLLCRNMIDLSESLGIISVAEGIESEEILTLLTKWGCKVGQGYHLFRPMPAEQFLKLILDSDPPLSPPVNRA